MNIRDNLKLREEFGRFFMANYPKVKLFAQQILKSEEDAEDIAQDIFLKLIDIPEVWRNKEMGNYYLFKVAKNHIFNFIKHQKIERKYQEALFEKNQIADEFDVDDKLHVREIELLLHCTVEGMPDRRKEVFKKSRFEGKSNLEIAAELDMSVRTVERHIYLALCDLKKKLCFHLDVE